MFSIIFPENTWSLKSNFPKKSSPSGRNLAQRFFRLHSSSLAQGCRIAPTLSVLSVTPGSHLLWVTHSVLLLSKSRAWPRCLDGSDRLRSQDPQGQGTQRVWGSLCCPSASLALWGWERMELCWEHCPAPGAAAGTSDRGLGMAGSP